MEDKYIVMKVSDLRLLLNEIKVYEHYYIYDSDQNIDGQSEWHCDVEIGNDPLDENSWGDGEEHWSFDSLENHITKFGRRQAEVQNALLDMVKTSLSSSPTQPRHLQEHLQEHLEMCQDMFDDFYNKAQQFIDKTKE